MSPTSVVIRVHRNPWPTTVPDSELAGIVAHVAATRAENVTKQVALGEYAHGNLAIAFLDPQAPRWLPSRETLLATIAIGEGGEELMPNAVAKAVYHRDHGQPAGFGVYVDLARSGDDDFRYGFSTAVDGLIVGASGQSELQDAAEAGHAGVSLNYWVRKARRAWLDANPRSPWLGGDDAGSTYRSLATGTSPIAASAG